METGALAEEARETSEHHAPRKNVMHTRIHKRVREKERDTTVSITSCSNAASQVYSGNCVAKSSNSEKKHAM